jgi:hypothetical protein
MVGDDAGVRGLLGRTVVTDPHGRSWDVGIRWLPRRPRWLGWGTRSRRERWARERGDGSSWLDDLALPLEFADDSLAGLVAVVALALLVFVIWFAVIPIAVLVLDVLFVVVLAVGGVAARLLFGRPWIVEAVSEGERVHWPVVGFGASRRAVRDAAEALAAGRPAATLGTSP